MSEMIHNPFDKEIAFYESIRAGNYEIAKLLSTPLCGEGYGILSRDPLRNIKYHLIISIAMITRFCIEGGMTPEESYSLSDKLIMMTDEAETVEQVHELHHKAIQEFCIAMNEIKIRGVNSLQIIKAIDYIKTHVSEKISINDIAGHLKISIPYLSRLFKAETGENVSEYVVKKKIESALIMLKYSGKSIAEISCYLNFSSQSYFTKVFKKYVGMTPKEYKNGNYFISTKDILDENYIKRVFDENPEE